VILCFLDSISWISSEVSSDVSIEDLRSFIGISSYDSSTVGAN